MATRDEVLAVVRESMSKEASFLSAVGRTARAARRGFKPQKASAAASKATKAVAKKPKSKLKRNLLLAGTGLAGASSIAGAASAAKEEAKRPLAPPTALPPGY